MAQIARLTTPAFTYKPSAVSMSDIAKIYFVLRQGTTEITKDITQATASEDGFTWVLAQTETQTLTTGRAVGQVDYLTTSGVRYTTEPKMFNITQSAINEVI